MGLEPNKDIINFQFPQSIVIVTPHLQCVQCLVNCLYIRTTADTGSIAPLYEMLYTGNGISGRLQYSKKSLIEIISVGFSDFPSPLQSESDMF